MGDWPRSKVKSPATGLEYAAVAQTSVASACPGEAVIAAGPVPDVLNQPDAQ